MAGISGKQNASEYRRSPVRWTGEECLLCDEDDVGIFRRTAAFLDEAGVAIPDEQEDEVERFREFLDNITPEDFGRMT